MVVGKKINDWQKAFLVTIAVLPSRSALSDLGLISDLFENMLLNWSFFLHEKSVCWPKQTNKSYFHCFSLWHKAKTDLNISSNMAFKKKLKKQLLCLMSELSFWNKSDFDWFSFGLNFGINIV